MFYIEKVNNKKILKTTALKGLNHCFTTRETVIKSSEAGMEELVKTNKVDLCNYFKITEEDLISPNQTHSTNISEAKEGIKIYANTDAIILTNKTQAVFLNFADCTPVIIFDPKNNIGAIAHAGWRGTAGKIVIKVIEKMANDYGSKPEELLSAIGPSIGKCCYPVGKEVYEQLKSTIKNSDNCFSTGSGEIFADLKKINKKQLEFCGVKQIDVCNFCTSCNNELFFSYRKENGTTSRHSAVIKLY